VKRLHGFNSTPTQLLLSESQRLPKWGNDISALGV
jgi:hypothetical protein